ncbi:hypothetical protein, partial [Pseudomonas syringae group genomosp. 7]|uniref:hypothetical protein n=1 Tax=Pseudomonas syringae group genomosp. 7 TaxID=251699 RepID=UPI00376F5DC6
MMFGFLIILFSLLLSMVIMWFVFVDKMMQFLRTPSNYAGRATLPNDSSCCQKDGGISAGPDGNCYTPLGVPT